MAKGRERLQRVSILIHLKGDLDYASIIATQ